MNVKATAKTQRISPRKMNLVAALVRGRTVNDALIILEHTPKKAASILRDVIKSAAANAEHNHDLNINNLEITEINVSAGIVIKRARAAARGRMHPIRHRTCHITVTVAEYNGKEKESAPAKKSASQTKTASKQPKASPAKAGAK